MSMKWLISACSSSLCRVSVRSFVRLLVLKASNPRFSHLTNMLRRDNQLILLLLPMKMVSHLNINEFEFECSFCLSVSLLVVVLLQQCEASARQSFNEISILVSRWSEVCQFLQRIDWEDKYPMNGEKKSRCTFLSFLFFSLSLSLCLRSLGRCWTSVYEVT